MNSSLGDSIEILLIINDSTSTKIHLRLSYVSNELISQICEELSLKYFLDERTKIKLNNYLCQEIIRLQNQKERNEELEIKRNEFFNKLYYESIKKKKEKEEANRKLRMNRNEKEMLKYSFTPSITVTASQLFNRQYKKIEDKLYGLSQKKQIRRRNDDNIGLDNLRLNCLTENNNKSNPYTQRRVKSDVNSCFKKNIQDDIATDIEKSQSTIKKSMSHFELSKPKEIKASNINKHTMTKDKKRRIIHNRSNTSYFNSGMLISENSEYKSTNRNNSNNNNKSNDGLLYRNKSSCSSKRTQIREREMNKLYQELYPFKPLISTKSQQMILKNNNESNKTRTRRLTESKRANSLQRALKNLHSLYNNSEGNTSRSIAKPQEHQSFWNSKNNKTKQKHDCNKRIIKTDIIETAISTNPQSCSFIEKRIRPIESMQEKIMIKSLKAINQSHNIERQHYLNSRMSNVQKYKLNQLKHIYELLISKNQGIDFDSLATNGIPPHIKDLVILPTCSLINRNHLEFNFHNFFLISSEILNKYF